jgi:lipoprotein-anchoring transpeptidase ErfK/SrfK
VQKRIIATLFAVIMLFAAAFAVTRAPADAVAADFDSAEFRLRVDLSERQLYVEENGSVVKTYAVAVGKAKHPTPRGTYAVSRVIWNPRWVPPNSEWARGMRPREPGDPRNPMGRVKAFFREPTYYLHGTDDEASIGRAASHGCVRLRNDDIIELSRMLVDHGGVPLEPSALQRIINRVRSEHQVRLSRPVPLRIQA